MIEEPEITEDRLLGGAVRLLQPRRGHRAGTDAVLLAALAPIGKARLVVDLGAASGAVGLMVARRAPEARIVMVERDPDLVTLCRRNIELNDLQPRAQALAADIFWASPKLAEAGLPLALADVVTTNPPYDEGPEGQVSPEPRRLSAHRMEGGNLAGWCRVAAALLKPKGSIALIHRADALARCLAVLAPAFGSFGLHPIYPRAGRPASRIVISGIKGGRGPTRILAPLVLHASSGEFTPEAASIHSTGMPDMKEAPEGAS